MTEIIFPKELLFISIVLKLTEIWMDWNPSSRRADVGLDSNNEEELCHCMWLPGFV